MFSYADTKKNLCAFINILYRPVEETPVMDNNLIQLETHKCRLVLLIASCWIAVLRSQASIMMQIPYKYILTRYPFNNTVFGLVIADPWRLATD